MRSGFPYRLFLFVFLGWTFDFYDLVLMGFVKDTVSESLHLTHQAEAWMLGVALGSSGLGGIAAGVLADRIGRRTMLASTVLIYSLGSLICGFAPSWQWFLIGRAIVGLGVGGEWAIGHSLLAEAVAPEFRGRAAAMLQAGEPVGVALAALAGFVIMPLVGWRAIMIGSAGTALLAVLVRRTLHVTDEPSAHAPLFAQLAQAFRSKVAAGSLSLGSRMLRAWLLGVFKLGTYWTCYIWLPSFLLKEMQQGVGKSFAWILSAQLGQLAGMLTFGTMADRFGRRPAFTAYSLLTAFAIGTLAFSWQWLSANPLLFWSTMVLLGIGSGCTAGFGALLAELYPSEVRTAAMGATYNLARAVQLGAPVLVSYAVEQHGLTGGLCVPLALALATASWVWVLPETRGIELPKLAN